MRKWKKNESWSEFMNRAKENGVSPARQETIDNQDKITDTERLDFLQSLLKANVVCRNSTRGRGFRLHQYRGKKLQSFSTVRDAIDQYMNNTTPDDTRCACKESEVLLGFYDICMKCKKLL